MSEKITIDKIRSVVPAGVIVRENPDRLRIEAEAPPGFRFACGEHEMYAFYDPDVYGSVREARECLFERLTLDVEGSLEPCNGNSCRQCGDGRPTLRLVR